METPKLTAFANQAFILAAAITHQFSARTYGSSPARKLRIDEPEGPSTDGGRRARQPLSLVAEGQAAPALICGWIDVSLKEAELRSYGAIANRFHERYGLLPDLPRGEYDRFAAEMKDILVPLGITHIASTPEEPLPAPPMPIGELPKRRTKVLAIALAVTAVALGILIARM